MNYGSETEVAYSHSMPATKKRSNFHFNRGARHGHSMKAKQERIARMEAKLLREMESRDDVGCSKR